MTDREIISTLASMNPLKPCHHLPTPSKAPSQPCSTLLPQNRQRNTVLRKSPPTLGARHRDAEPKKPPAQHRQSCAPAQNTCHDRKWCTKHLSYLPVIEPQRQNPCCRTLALTCADAGCPSTPGSHDFGPPRQQAGTMNPPKNPTPNDPLLCPSGANTDRPTRVRCPPCSPNPCLLYTSPSPRDQRGSRMPSSA